MDNIKTISVRLTGFVEVGENWIKFPSENILEIPEGIEPLWYTSEILKQTYPHFLISCDIINKEEK